MFLNYNTNINQFIKFKITALDYCLSVEIVMSCFRKEKNGPRLLYQMRLIIQMVLIVQHFI